MGSSLDVGIMGSLFSHIPNTIIKCQAADPAIQAFRAAQSVHTETADPQAWARAEMKVAGEETQIQHVECCSRSCDQSFRIELCFAGVLSALLEDRHGGPGRAVEALGGAVAALTRARRPLETSHSASACEREWIAARVKLSTALWEVPPPRQLFTRPPAWSCPLCV